MYGWDEQTVRETDRELARLHAIEQDARAAAAADGDLEVQRLPATCALCLFVRRVLPYNCPINAKPTSAVYSESGCSLMLCTFPSGDRSPSPSSTFTDAAPPSTKSLCVQLLKSP